MNAGNKKLTKQQAKVYEYLKQEIREKGFPPSIREICAAVSLKSTSSVHSHLATLEKKNLIKKLPNKNRTIEILEPNFYQTDSYIAEVPLVGKVTAGEPILAVENIEESIPLPMDFLGRNETFMLRVSGQSMIEKGIMDKDLVIVNKQSHAENGDIVVAMLDDSATVKTFYRENGHIRLQPANPDYEPIITRTVDILGKVIGLIRRY